MSATIIYTCPLCGHDLNTYQITTNPPIDVLECPNCKWKSEEKQSVFRTPYNDNLKLVASPTDDSVNLTIGAEKLTN